MKKPPQQPVASDPNWRNLRDEDGRLYGRVNRVRMILEIRRNQKTITFDLSELIVVQEKRDIVDSK